MIIDEAARLKPSIWEGAPHAAPHRQEGLGAAHLDATRQGLLLRPLPTRPGRESTPTTRAGTIRRRTNPHLDAAVIEAERARLPERVFRQEFGAEFLEGAGQVFRNVRECATGVFQDPVPDASYYAGLDLAKVEDYTVLVIANRKREVVFADRFHRIDWQLQVNRIQAATDRFNRCRTLVDSTGSGEPVYESLRKAGSTPRAMPSPRSRKPR